MTIRQSIFQAAARSGAMLGDERRRRAVDFLQGQLTPGGGFANRVGKSDVYYTVFGLEAILALECDDLPWLGQLVAYLDSASAGDGLDLVHLVCLTRALADVKEWHGRPAHESHGCLARANVNDGRGGMSENLAGILRNIETFRSADGGYNQVPASRTGSAYGCFLALGAYQDGGRAIPNAQGLLDSLAALRMPNGAYANDRYLPVGLAPATAAAVMALTQLNQEVAPETARWLTSCCSAEGGFRAMPRSPISDLLSTATSLHALAALNKPLVDPNAGAAASAMAQSCASFVLNLQTPSGGFAANLFDATVDCEYTFYALLSMGHLPPTKTT